ncbi:protein FAM107B isoform X1 [Gouania willdenowi]|nr:protein FAM107B isoform X1 [Gouania willdenowi]
MDHSSRNKHTLQEAGGPIIKSQPAQQQADTHCTRTMSCISIRSTRTRRPKVTRTSSRVHHMQDQEYFAFNSPPRCFSGSSEDEELDLEGNPLKFPHIPRPSIIVRHQDSEWQETASDESDCIDTEDGALSDRCDPTLSLSAGRSVMAEPDYLDGDCDELIKPKKLINPVKNSRNHQDLHRELLMNQKRGLAPQNKPELQKVLEKRKREQILKAQKDEQEAHKKRSDLEIELMKRQQKLEQLELDQQKDEEEQENTPEFVKMKSNLRRTRQAMDDEERTT